MIYKEWLKAAADDLLLIEKILDDEHLTHLASFHAQQAIEKSLKAYMEFKRLPFIKTHKLQTLIDRCSIELSPQEDELLQLLDTLYVESRYPGEFGLLPNGKPSLKESKLFFDFAKKFHNSIKDRIDNES